MNESVTQKSKIRAAWVTLQPNVELDGCLKLK